MQFCCWHKICISLWPQPSLLLENSCNIFANTFIYCKSNIERGSVTWEVFQNIPFFILGRLPSILKSVLFKDMWSFQYSIYQYKGQETTGAWRCLKIEYLDTNLGFKTGYKSSAVVLVFEERIMIGWGKVTPSCQKVRVGSQGWWY